MRVLVRLFASYREAAGVGRIELELPPGATVKDAIKTILKDHPLVAEGRQVVIARNREYVTPDEPLADGDEVALIPPVSGGAMTIAPIMVSASPLSENLDNLKRMEDLGASAVVLFSLFEEQIRYERYELHLSTTQGTESYPEALSYFPEPGELFVGPEAYLKHIARAKATVPAAAPCGYSQRNWAK